MQVNAQKNPTNFGIMKFEVSPAQIRDVAQKQYKEYFPQFLRDLKFVGELEEILKASTGKDMVIRVSTEGDTLVYKSDKRVTKNLGEAVMDSCNGEVSPHTSLYMAIKSLGKIPQ